MTNDFTQETRELFIWNTLCWYCKRNHANCLHHILGRISNSPLNSAPLNNFECHINNGKLATDKLRSEMLVKTLMFLKTIDYQFTPEDIEFIEKHEYLYKFSDTSKKPLQKVESMV